MGKIEKWHFLPSHCKYFDKTFTEIFLEYSSISHIIFAHSSVSLVAMETKTQNKNIEKILKKLSPQKKPYALWGLDYVEMFIILAFTDFMGFYAPNFEEV